MDGEPSHAAWQPIAVFAAPPAVAASAVGLLIRAGAPSARILSLLSALEQYAPGQAAAQIVSYPGVGLAYARWTLAEALDASPITQAIEALRRALSAEEGYAVIEDAPAALRVRLDLWGPPPATLPLMRALKSQWDPARVLNRGRYLGGL